MRNLVIGIAFLLIASASVMSLAGLMKFRGTGGGMPDTNLSVTYPEEAGKETLSDQQLQMINGRLSKYLHQYDSAKLYINHFPKRERRDKNDSANFKLIIRCKDGKTLQSKTMYTTEKRLAKEITHKIDKAFRIDRFKYRNAVMIMNF